MHFRSNIINLLTCWVKVNDQALSVSREDDHGLACTLPPARILVLTPRGRARTRPSFQTHRQAVHTPRASDQSGEGAQLLRQGQRDLILIIDGICRTRQTGLQSPPTADFPWGTSVLQSASSSLSHPLHGRQRWQGWGSGVGR